jgi:hypothetical protein
LSASGSFLNVVPGAVQQRLPAQAANPALQGGAVDAGLLVVVEVVGDAVVVSQVQAFFIVSQFLMP